jgi:hypothetical protein
MEYCKPTVRFDLEKRLNAGQFGAVGCIETAADAENNNQNAVSSISHTYRDL